MPNMTNTALINITATEDTTQNVIVNRTVPNLNFDSNSSTGVMYASLANGANAIPLPAATCYQLYVRNNDPANTIIVSTNVGIIGTLKPGEVCLLWQKATGTPGVGFTSVGMNASGANTLVEYFIGA